MRLGRRFYIALVLIVLLMGIGYVFAPFFAIGQWALFVLAVSAHSRHPGIPPVCYPLLQRR
mgnify:CR=1 FL=1